MTVHKFGDQVVFVGREVEMGKYHPDYVQLLGQIGTVIEADMEQVNFEYVVIFNEFPDVEGDCHYVCRKDEIQVAP
jgi:hypothetical protein